ncbi:hypothetical protein H112_02201 [Trichophyton rubrum D6]|uniref:Septin-type G domain-containing protein n=4 Tax=Trichophyton TaxID=5550 RepID=A0A178EZQ8_TRIRU|nr:hypothetical protein H100_02201 [Trichophyton rubrum MR850]EZF44510.1 hypothetical protein H102_02197 [Trichophyton rubrum CBS 100081]EZF55199.1 hypothetical protein H103_02206 [Trichophyton rubrum CBS 288.86]EZF65797.1 hypothetical protein H104_02181 [Trichophyton rubrum CBS 289.86]EZF76457.1 hypothetical protein H105_02218 [Trichophyton soudanense CBS 452.61]EZF87074.1 hypothetical protein H110_02203 [Trichophyton rubrum MR1448]EZG19454.1 hypothetical protein H107_02271 [Trichophyton rub
MRPAASSNSARGRPRKTATPNIINATPSSELRNASPPAFFLSRGNEMDGSDSSAPGTPNDSTYGVQSLADTIDDGISGPLPPFHSDVHATPEGDVGSSPLSATSRAAMPNTQEHKTEDSLKPHHYPLSDIGITLSGTPSFIGSPGEPNSLPSSPKSSSTRSLRNVDDMPAVGGSGYTDGEPDINEAQVEPTELQDSTSQLVMPSIKIPSRRPFTDRGKAMGRLKILLAGAPGCGKTSLLKSFGQLSADIVHMDPLPDSVSIPPSSLVKSRRKGSTKPRRIRECEPISEIYASTKPYPSWWSDMDDSRVLRRRKSLGDVILERNLCFVDTFAGSKNADQQTEVIIQYMNKQFTRAVSAVRSVTTDFQGLLCGNGGPQVDVILYLISEKTMTADIRSIQKLSNFTTVVPLIAKCDNYTPAEVQAIKKSFIERVRDADMKLSCFGPFGESLTNDHVSGPGIPFMASSATTNDDETMDASVLMSPEYVQPLVPSDLGFVLERLLDRDNAAWFRHSAAKKLVEVQQQPRSRAPSNNFLRTSSNYGVSSLPDSHLSPYLPSTPASASHVLAPPGERLGLSEYTLARMTEHTRREEQYAQARLAKWAADLQQSLQNERNRYEQLGRGERAVWLTEKLGECVADGTLVPLSQTPGFPGFGNTVDRANEKGNLCVQTQDGRRFEYRVAAGNVNAADPLGLLKLGDDLSRRGWVLVQVLGGVGIVGGLALWMAQTWGLSGVNGSAVHH